MWSLHPLPPHKLKETLEAEGWIVVDETENGWLLADPKEPKAGAVPIPKKGDLVAREVMENVMNRAKVRRAIVRAVQDHVATAPTPPTPPSSPPPAP